MCLREPVKVEFDFFAFLNELGQFRHKITNNDLCFVPQPTKKKSGLWNLFMEILYKYGLTELFPDGGRGVEGYNN